MSVGDESNTCWALIRGAAAGDEIDRALFTRRYLPVVRAYLLARWRGSPLGQQVDDAVQEVFLESFRARGVLSKADSTYPGGFRALLFGVVRNVSLRAERSWAQEARQKGQGESHLAGLATDDERVSRVFDRAWARSVIRQAVGLQQQRARARGEEARGRVELLRLRFEEELPIREIAARWGREPSALHRAYRIARKEFRDCLRQVVAANNPGAGESVDRECVELLALLD